jgi:hypothetical protein
MSPFLADFVAKLFSRLPTRNIDSKMIQSAQYRIRDTGLLGFDSCALATQQRVLQQNRPTAAQNDVRSHVSNRGQSGNVADKTS